VGEGDITLDLPSPLSTSLTSERTFKDYNFIISIYNYYDYTYLRNIGFVFEWLSRISGKEERALQFFIVFTYMLLNFEMFKGCNFSTRRKITTVGTTYQLKPLKSVLRDVIYIYT